MVNNVKNDGPELLVDINHSRNSRGPEVSLQRNLVRNRYRLEMRSSRWGGGVPGGVSEPLSG
jgi:hypothetical protein